MLNKLIIKNVALIDYAEIDFTFGLNVLSGETGSGKSVILECINFVLGAKADKSFIRDGENDCLVQAEFDVSNNKVIKNLLEDNDFEVEDVILISRKITKDGKNTVKINGNTVTVGMLKAFTSNLIDVHGQSEHFSLLKNSNQLSLIDEICGEDCYKIKEEIKKEINEYKTILSNLDELGGDESQRAIRVDILDYQIKEITSVNLKDGEEEELLDLKSKINNLEKIKNALYAVKSISSGDLNFFSLLADAKKQISNISDISEDYLKLSNRISDISVELSDLSDTADNLIDGLFDMDVDSNYVESRLEQIKNLKRKYGNSFEEINLFLSNALEEKNKLENFNTLANDLLNKKSKFEKEIYKLYNKLSNIRKEKSLIFSNAVKNELFELGMKGADFTVSFKDLPSIEDSKFVSINGIDELEFLFSANVGESLKPLSNVISGGEMSRFMLAVKTQSSKANFVQTFIFDEIDSGISGNTAKIVAYKFAKIAKNTQILAISHLPQISAMADTNFLICKKELDGRTVTRVEPLSSEDKILEVSRLVGGDFNSENSILLAKELVENADAYKNNIK